MEYSKRRSRRRLLDPDAGPTLPLHARATPAGTRDLLRARPRRAHRASSRGSACASSSGAFHERYLFHVEPNFSEDDVELEEAVEIRNSAALRGRAVLWSVAPSKSDLHREGRRRSGSAIGRNPDEGDGIPWPGSWRIPVWNVMDVVGHQSVACQLKMRKAKVFAQR